ncbi:MAG TPA: response regulator [Bacteroidota bacterium]|nr:response regulator [Bacteroidota bacterium]
MVEDNLAHLTITRYVLRKNNVEGEYFVVRDGQEALDFLFHRGQYSDTSRYPMPDLILLDLNLPKRDGREVLKIIKSDSVLTGIPVVIVSTSNREEDIQYALQMGAVSYISKSSGFDQLHEALGGIVKFTRSAMG